MIAFNDAFNAIAIALPGNEDDRFCSIKDARPSQIKFISLRPTSLAIGEQLSHPTTEELFCENDLRLYFKLPRSGSTRVLGAT
jgi:hypothetical protein